MTAQEPILLPYQRRWVADQSDIRIVEKSRRVGISWATAAEAALEAAAQNGMDVWYIGYTKDMAQEFIRDCAMWGGAYQLAVEGSPSEFVFEEDEDKIPAFKIDFKSENRITALSSRPTNLRGKQGFVIIDEAAFHNDLEGLVKAAIALLMWVGRGKIAIISTHFGVENRFNELISEVLAGKRQWGRHRISLDDALAEGLFKQICAMSQSTKKPVVWSPEAEAAWRAKLIQDYGDHADEELFCIPSQGSGFYLSRSLVERRMVPAPVLRVAYPEGYEFVREDIRRAEVQDWINLELAPLVDALPKAAARSSYGMDFARSRHLSVIAPMIRDKTFLGRRVPFTVEICNAPHKVQEQILFWLVDRLPGFECGAMDAGGNGSYLAESAAEKYGDGRIHRIQLSQGWYRDNLPRYKAGLEDAEILLPKDEDLLTDHRAFVREKGVLKVSEKETKGTDGKPRHGDGALACLLADFASRQGGGPIEFMALGQTRVGASLADYLGG